MVMTRKLRWLGHIERLEDSRLPKCFLVYMLAGHWEAVSWRPEEEKWCDVVASDLKWCDLCDDSRKIAQDREHGDAWCMEMLGEDRIVGIFACLIFVVKVVTKDHKISLS